LLYPADQPLSTLFILLYGSDVIQVHLLECRSPELRLFISSRLQASSSPPSTFTCSLCASFLFPGTRHRHLFCAFFPPSFEKISGGSRQILLATPLLSFGFCFFPPPLLVSSPFLDFRALNAALPCFSLAVFLKRFSISAKEVVLN